MQYLWAASATPPSSHPQTDTLDVIKSLVYLEQDDQY